MENASEIEIKLLSVVADNVGFKIDGGSVSLSGIRKVEDDFEEKEFNATFEQSIDTPDIVLKKYNEMKNK